MVVRNNFESIQIALINESKVVTIKEFIVVNIIGENDRYNIKNGVVLFSL